MPGIIVELGGDHAPPPSCRTQGMPDPLQAEACFAQALTIARAQQARSLELRATLSLSRLWQQQGKRAEARTLLEDLGTAG